MIRIEDEVKEIKGTPFTIISEGSSVIKSLYQDAPIEIKPIIKKFILSFVNEALEGNNDGEKSEGEDKIKLTFSEKKYIQAGADAMLELIKRDPKFLLKVDEYMFFHALAGRIFFGKDKEEKK